jgi:hypothetical protein
MSPSRIVKPKDPVPEPKRLSLPKASSKWEGRHLDDLKVHSNPGLYGNERRRAFAPEVKVVDVELDEGMVHN